MTKYLHYFTYLLLLLCAPIWGLAQNGTLKGTVKDKTTKEPLIGATVFIVGTYKGAATDLDGNYEIKDVKHGDYTIKVSFVGYTEKLYNGIRISKDQTTQLNIELSEQGKTLDAVEVVGEKNVVDLESGKSEVRITSADIKEMNVRNVQGVVAMQAGVSQSPDGLQIRGGRVYETQFVVDGVNAQDPLAGTGFGTEVSSGSVQDLAVITGGSDAEYNGTSGIIVTKIKEGGDKLKVYGNWQRDNLGFNKMQGTAWNTDIAELAIGGPVPFTSKRIKFFTSLNVGLSDQYYRLTANQLKSSILPDSTMFAPRQDNKWSHTLKLSYDIARGSKISFTNQHSILVNQNSRTLQVVGFSNIMAPGLQYGFANSLDNATTYTHRSNLSVLNFQQLLNKNLTLDVAVGRLFTNLRADANGRAFRDATIDKIYDPASIVTNPVIVYNPNSDTAFVLPGDGLYNNGGISTVWHDHYVNELTLKYKFNYFSPNKRHFVTFGQEHKHQDLQWADVSSPWVGAPIKLPDGTYIASRSIGTSSDLWHVKPSSGGFFAQDEIKYKGISAVIGARLEYWAPGKFADDAVDNPDALILQSVRDDYKNQTTKLFGLRWKARLLPKLRVSFPITENNVMYFNYGHSMRLPHPRFVYAGLDPKYQSRSALSDLGNPNLNPEVAVSYELGIKSQITRDFGVTFTAFYKDYFDFIVNRTLTFTGDPTRRAFAINQDYARIRGLEVMLNYRLNKNLRASFNAAYQVATGKSNTAAESRLQIEKNGSVNTTKEQYLAWDRPFDLKGSLIYTPDTSAVLFGVPLKGFRFFFTSTYKSGLRYTPQRFVGYDLQGRAKYESIDSSPYSKIGSSWFWSDVKITRDFRFGKKQFISLSVEINNIFNNKNAQIINPVTGKAYSYGDPLPYTQRDPVYANPESSGLPPTNPARYMQPRQILYGVSFSF